MKICKKQDIEEDDQERGQCLKRRGRKRERRRKAKEAQRWQERQKKKGRR